MPLLLNEAVGSVQALVKLKKDSLAPWDTEGLPSENRNLKKLRNNFLDATPTIQVLLTSKKGIPSGAQYATPERTCLLFVFGNTTAKIHAAQVL